MVGRAADSAVVGGIADSPYQHNYGGKIRQTHEFLVNWIVERAKTCLEGTRGLGGPSKWQPKCQPKTLDERG